MDPVPPPPQFVFPPQHGAAAGPPPGYPAVPSQPPSAAAHDGGQTSHVAYPGSPAAMQRHASRQDGEAAFAAAPPEGVRLAAGIAVPIGAFNAATTEPSDADMLEAPREQHQPVDSLLGGADLAESPGKAGQQAHGDLAAVRMQQPVDAS